jgi:hydrogenase expression/formation protein HypC
MCLAIPMRVVKIDGFLAVAEVDGVRREARLDLLSDVAVGDYILVHAGLAIATVDPKDAEETLDLLRQLADEVQ